MLLNRLTRTVPHVLGRPVRARQKRIPLPLAHAGLVITFLTVFGEVEADGFILLGGAEANGGAAPMSALAQ